MYSCHIYINSLPEYSENSSILILKFKYTVQRHMYYVGMCTLLLDEYYEYDYTDADGWPHFKELKPMEAMFIKIQETFLKQKIVQYFKEKVY